MPHLLEKLSVETKLPRQKYVTAERATIILNVPQSYFDCIVAESTIPSELIGGVRKVLLVDLLEYKQRSDEAAAKAFREMTQEAQAMGLY